MHITDMIEWLDKKRNGESAQALIFAIITVLVIISFVAFVVNSGRVINHKIKMQTAADASAISGAIWQARALNMIAILNAGILVCGIAIGGMVTAIGASSGKLIFYYAKYIRRVYRAARQMAKVQNIIKNVNPIIVEGEVFRIANANGIKGAVAVAPELTPWPRLHIHQFGKAESYDPGTSWDVDEGKRHYHPSDEGIDTLIPMPYLRDSNFDDMQYVFCIAVDEPAKIVTGTRIFGVRNPVLLSLPELDVGGYKLGGDIGYITTAQARPVNPIEPHPFLLIPQWDVELTPVSAPADIPIPGLDKIIALLQGEFLCH